MQRFQLRVSVSKTIYTFRRIIAAIFAILVHLKRATFPNIPCSYLERDARTFHFSNFHFFFFSKIVRALRLLYVRFGFAHSFYRTETLIDQVWFRQNPNVDLEISCLTAELHVEPLDFNKFITVFNGLVKIKGLVLRHKSWYG
jgi:hypothetical protein